MHRWLLVLAFSSLVAACADDRDPGRYQFGVSGDRPAASANAQNDQAMRTYLDAKANQICTRGYEVAKVETLGAEDAKEIVDLDLRCHTYSLDLIPTVSLSNLF